MGTENNKQDKQPDKQVVKKNDSPNMFLAFIKKNIVSVLLFLALIIAIKFQSMMEQKKRGLLKLSI